jgi:hypothetical protein
MIVVDARKIRWAVHVDVIIANNNEERRDGKRETP